jgi:glutathione S-transferase
MQINRIRRISFFFVVFVTSRDILIEGLAWSNPIKNMFGKTAAPTTAAAKAIVSATHLPPWEELSTFAKSTATGQRMELEADARGKGGGLSHQDAKVRLFGTKGEPRVTYYRDTAAWCPYCQKVWILLEEKKIPYNVEKIAMRSYGDKPQSYLKLVPNGLLPAINIDGQFMTESLDIMMTLDRTFKGPDHPPMWPARGNTLVLSFTLHCTAMLHTSLHLIRLVQFAQF